MAARRHEAASAPAISEAVSPEAVEVAPVERAMTDRTDVAIVGAGVIG